MRSRSSCCDPPHSPQRTFSNVRHIFYLFVILALILPAWTAHAQYDGEPIAQVEILGLIDRQAEKILPRLRTQAGKTYNSVLVGEDLTDLSAMMRTATVQVEPAADRAGIVVRFLVSEFPRLRQIQIIGNESLKTERAERLVDLNPGDVLGERTQNRIRRSFENEYKALGRPAAEIKLNLIDVDVDAGEAPQADLQIVIEEGRQILIDDVRIEGNEAFGDMRLRAVMQTKGSWAFLKNYYAEKMFEEDLVRIQDLYMALGYFDARVERGMFEERTVKNKSILTPVVRIEEGERYRFGDARIRGARLFSHAELLEIFDQLKDKPYDARTFARALEQVRSLYLDHGLLTTELQPQYEYDETDQRIDVLLEIQEKDRIYIGNVRIQEPSTATEPETGFRGWYQGFAPPIKGEVIGRELLLKPGDIYNKSLERESLHRLSHMGVFETESLNIYNEPTAEAGVQNLVVAYREAATGTASIGVGFGDASGAFIYGSYVERNWGGNADVLSLTANLGQRDSGAELSYLNRHIGETNNSLFGRIFFQALARPGYRANTGGVNAEWGRPLRNRWKMALMGRIEYVGLSERDGYHAKEDLNKGYPLVTARLRFEQDTRLPLGQRPREGYQQQYSAELGYAGGPLARFNASRDQYWRVSERLTYRLAANAGLMPYDRGTVPIHERYFLGGSEDMRGFRYRGAGYFDSKDEDVPIGGAAKILVRNELHFPLFDPISGVVFADVGALGRSPISWQVPRVSTGLGLAFDMKNVDVAIDLAVPLTAQGDDQTSFFHFSLQSRL